MKAHKLFIPVLLSLFSCSSPTEKAIKDYVQTIGDVKTDMKFKLKSLHEIGSVLSRDSMRIIEGDLGGMSMDTLIEFHKKYISAYQRGIFVSDSLKAVYLEESKTQPNHLAELYINSIQRVVDDKKEYEEKLKQHEIMLGNCIKSNDNYNRYIKDTLAILAHKVKCTFTIKNPLFNGSEQEITKTFLLSPDSYTVLNEIDE